MKKAYLAYPGLGKTTLAQKNKNFEDVETKLFKDLALKEYIGTYNYPNFRGVKIEDINPDYPNNLYDYTKNLIKDGKILLLVFKDDSIDLLNHLNIDFDVIFPSKERLEKLKSDYIKRGDDEDYINNNLGKRYENSIEQAKELGKQIYFLKENEYLEDLIKIL